MEGIAERDRRGMERIILQAWWTANLDGAGADLKRPSYYLDQLKPKKPQTDDEVLAWFVARKAGGGVRIRHIGPDGQELN
jgi:hypothetical protein